MVGTYSAAFPAEAALDGFHVKHIADFRDHQRRVNMARACESALQIMNRSRGKAP